MALKNLTQLKAEIDLAVHPDGPLGKTTAPNLNALLTSLATELTATAAAPPLTNVVQLTTDQRVAGTKTFTDQLVISQQAAQAKGILINGTEVSDSTYNSESGVRIALGVNRDGNRQLWLGDDSAYGHYDKGVLRYQTGTRLPRLDAVSGDGNNRMNIAIGTDTSNVAIGGQEQHPSERLEVFGNVKAEQFIGDGSRLTGISPVAVELDLTSNSTTSAPAVAAVVSKFNFIDSAFTARTLWVKSGSPASGVRGNSYFPFSSLPDALANAQEGDTIMVLPGGTGIDSLGRAYYSEDATVTHSARIIFAEGVVYGGALIIGEFAGYNAYRTSIYGGEFINRILMCRQYTQSSLTVHNTCFTGALGGVQYVANHFDNTNSFNDTYLLRDCVFDTTRPVGSNAPVRNHGRDEFGACDMILDNCLVITDGTPCITYSSKLGGHVIVSGTTELRPGTGQPALESLPVVPSYVTVATADWFVDNRSIAALTNQLKDLQTASDTAESKLLVVQGYGQTAPGVRGSFLRPYASPAEAINAAQDGDTILILPGGDSVDSTGRRVYTAGVGTSSKSITVQAVGSVYMSGYWICGDYPGAATSYHVTFKGIHWTAGLAIIANAGPGSQVVFEDCSVTDNSSLFILAHGFDIAPFTPGTDNYTFRRCTIEVTQTNGVGPFKLQSRNDAGPSQTVNIYLEDTKVSAAASPVFTGYLNVDTHFYLRGSTTLTPGTGQAVQTITRVNTSTIIPDAELLVDERATKGYSIHQLPIYTAAADGPQVIMLPVNALGVLDVQVLDPTANSTRPLFPSYYSLINGELRVAIEATVRAGNKIGLSYYTAL